MKCINVSIKHKIDNILDCLHLDKLKDHKSENELHEKILGLVPVNKDDDEIDNHWIYNCDSFPLMFTDYIKYEELSIKSSLIIPSKLNSYPKIKHNAKQRKKIADYIVIMKDRYVLKCIDSSNINSIMDVANILTYHFMDLELGDIREIKSSDDIYVYVCKID